MARNLLVCLVALASLGGCGAFKQPREAAACKGPVFVLNADRWTPGAEELGR